ncbi:hypothetical protein L218DRAFT_962613 [Marasmius fiardii PR-910]|nr:hypothetical protein L218DRAFT_962613 [Marasmius fiardii PR-910]
MSAVETRPSELLTAPLIPALSLSSLLYATLSIQVYVYLSKFPRDPILLKCFVGGIFLIITAQLLLMHEFCWDVYVTGIGIQANSPSPQVGTAVHTILTAIVSGTIQVFFAWRIYTLRRDSIIVKIIAVLIVLLALENSAACMAGSSSFLAAANSANGVDLLRRFAKLPQAWMIGAVICDLFIAAAMTTILIQYGRASSVKRTKTLVKSLILRSVETGTVTFIFTLINLVLFELYPQNYVYMIFDRPLASLYANALLVSLNARQSGANISTTNWSNIRVDSSYNTNSFGLAVVSGPHGYTQRSDAIHIAKQTTTQTHVDSQLQLSNKGSKGSMQDFPGSEV